MVFVVGKAGVVEGGICDAVMEPYRKGRDRMGSEDGERRASSATEERTVTSHIKFLFGGFKLKFEKCTVANVNFLSNFTQ